MTTQDNKPDTGQASAKTQLRPAPTDWTLRAKDPAPGGQVFPVRGELRVGREGCDIPLSSEHASRKHARVFLDGGVLQVQDLESANGTFVNDERIDAAELKPGDEVRFDVEAFIVDGPQQSAPPGDDNRTAVRAAQPQSEPEAEGAATKDTVAAPAAPAPESTAEQNPAAQEEPAAPASEAQPEPAQRGAWYERETPNQTRKMDSNEMSGQFAEGGTQVVRGVKEVETPSLIGASEEWAGRVIKLDRDTMTVGRSGTDIELDEPSVSTKHAQIVREDDRWKVIDLMSANGVYVNGNKTQVAFLSPGDAVRFGRLEMRFVTDTTQVESRASPGVDKAVTGSAPAGAGAWLYFVIGFVAVLGIGAYLLFTTGWLGAGG